MPPLPHPPSDPRRVSRSASHEFQQAPGLVGASPPITRRQDSNSQSSEDAGGGGAGGRREGLGAAVAGTGLRTKDLVSPPVSILKRRDEQVSCRVDEVSGLQLTGGKRKISTAFGEDTTGASSPVRKLAKISSGAVTKDIELIRNQSDNIDVRKNSSAGVSVEAKKRVPGSPKMGAPKADEGKVEMKKEKSDKKAHDKKGDGRKCGEEGSSDGSKSKAVVKAVSHVSAVRKDSVESIKKDVQLKVEASADKSGDKVFASQKSKKAKEMSSSSVKDNKKGVRPMTPGRGKGEEVGEKRGGTESNKADESLRGQGTKKVWKWKSQLK